MSADAVALRAGSRTVELGKPDKELFGGGGVTKRELAEHYRAVAPVMLPHVRDRPLALHRFPDGIFADGGSAGFFQKRLPAHAPDWVGGVEVHREQGGSITMAVCDDTAGLLWLADQAVVTLHPWLSRTGDLERPDRVVVDLDPAGDDFALAREAARDVRAGLEEAGLVPFVMTTGSRGLHVVAPIRPQRQFDTVRAFARRLADRVARRRPDAYTTEFRTDKRRGRLFLDVLRNAYAQHAVAPYSVRALPGAPVAVPVAWEELDGLGSAREWTVRTLGGRLERMKEAGGDPWQGMARRARSPHTAAERWERAQRRSR
ncbi:non-homologous end-joining DNA ligase [Streptomonospora salina]|uniref:Bifunctional non-homologous end joining protein LigD n=1 Tax=Streptomonospora salina TaxID=104205 RepID=A0A841E2M9_9ACTN|nr:non-homologous end-joining DNA ligase [Streptomonospora salina]MBB5996724.1 bifunctional non-homologous end joining protein LigD [Streptomonospora salina]